MADRLAELRRQRALLQVHLAWLDREITRAGGDPNAGSLTPFGSTPSTSPFVSGSIPPLAVVPPRATPSAAAEPAPEGPPPTARLTTSALPPAVPAVAGGKPETDALLSQFRRAPEALRRDVRQGCLLYFAGALVLLALGVATLYLTFRAG